MNEQQDETPLVLFARTLENFPGFLIGQVVFGMGTAILGDFLVTSLCIGCVALGFATTVWIGVATFFVMYTILRTINNVANAIGVSSQRLAMVLQPRPPAIPSFPVPVAPQESDVDA